MRAGLPTGIDIRNGLQYECIGCGLCVDACNTVMDKVGYPRGLIRFATQSGMRQRWTNHQMLRRVFRPRVLGYGAVLLTLAVAMMVSLVTRTRSKWTWCATAPPLPASCPGQAGKRVPAANHERHRNAAALPHQRPGLGGADAGPGFNRAKCPPPARAGCRCSCKSPTAAQRQARTRSTSPCKPWSTRPRCREKATFLVPR